MPCCQDGTVPAVLYATFTGGTLGLACLNGVTVPINWDSGTTTWRNPDFTACGQQNFCVFNCNPTDSRWNIQFNFAPGGSADLVGGSCTPFVQVFSALSGTIGGISGVVKVTVTA